MLKQLVAHSLCAILTLGASTLSLAYSPPLSIPVYSDDFGGASYVRPGITAAWSPYKTGTTPTGRKFLGQFGPEPALLRLAGIPAHSEVTLAFDLFVIGNWDGNGKTDGTQLGPDIWDLSVVGGRTLLHTTFSNFRSWAEPAQAYPGTYPGAVNNGATGAAETESLGYGAYHDSVYHLSFNFVHSAGLLALRFSCSTSERLEKKFGLDNVSVSVDPPHGHPTFPPVHPTVPPVHPPHPPVHPPANAKPDLAVQLSAPVYARAGENIGGSINVTAKNLGGAPAPGTTGALDPANGFMVDVVLSSDPHVPPGFAVFSASFVEDALLKGGRISNTADLAPLATRLYPALQGGSGTIPANIRTGLYYICARIDPGNKVAESNEGNNGACRMIKIEGMH